MKPILLLILLAAPLRAGLLATFHTTQGDVAVELQYDKTPQTVANFITLAQGTRTSLNPATGAVIRKPFYAGEKFFRVEINPTYKIAQTGSGTGNNSGGPGYTFRDEFDPSLTHVPYVLAMANGGPHTNGSQIYFTGDLAVPNFDNRYTVFGLVTDPASRTVIDAIIAAGANATTINSVSFDRTDPAAAAFDEHAQNLPVCSGIAGNLEVAPGAVSYQLEVAQPAGSMFQVFRSLDLQSWAKLGQLYQATGEAGADKISFDNATLTRAFYNILLVTYPDALAPASLSNRTLIMGTSGSRTFTMQFDESGFGGTFLDTNDASGPTPITNVSYTPKPYVPEWVIDTATGKRFGFVCPLNSETTSEILGTNQSYQWLGFWSAISSGTLTLSK